MRNKVLMHTHCTHVSIQILCRLHLKSIKEGVFLCEKRGCVCADQYIHIMGIYSVYILFEYRKKMPPLVAHTKSSSSDKNVLFILPNFYVLHALYDFLENQQKLFRYQRKFILQKRKII